ncbi:hypothetical protein GCM10027429_05100 [Marivirga atlantica]|jgi:energy-coupling factor transporter ATP-binding protein EcfA2/chemotaxis protein histidine kinase CheA|uniref:High-affnity carbon uptake protein Hat/HatR n=1 Tax=Marivirga atlantica TaxID=1548457 RepID=A0A937DIS7_9BACT|nr:High-affnity carbon uptake protein Hat/HatR [Marivirga atlantica]MBL0764119.1 High-affnity carbon uptake protein Hat/HatR [Marivirga atlantica]
MKLPETKNIDPQVNYGKAHNPFPGLRPFKIEESHLFFGREGQSDEVLLKLSQHRFVGVIGPSGSGKSSFIYCGVLPILYGGFLTGTSTEWEVVVTRPGASPIDNLAQALMEADLTEEINGEEDLKIKKTIISSMLKSSSLGLVETILQFRRDSDKNYLILVDQFEELFRFKDSSSANSVNETLAFINLLMEAINHQGAPIYVAITMRSDFIGECSQFPELTKKINDSQYLIPQMTRDQKRRAITGPVAVGNAAIAPRLVQQLLNDLGDNPDQLPILQHALMRTWDYWTHFKDFEEEPLDIKHYEAIGTMAEALSMHANEAYDELNEEQKRICESLFKAITEKRGGSFGIRRPTKLSEIASIASTSEHKLIDIIDKFRDPSRSLLTPQYGIRLDEDSIIDISHESLMRIWSRLKNWVNDEEDAVAMYKRLAEAAEMYQEGKTSLWRPPDLQLALNWKEKHNPTLIWGQRYHPAYERTLSFLEHSEEEYVIEQKAKELQQKRRLRTARMTALVMGAATVISILFLVYAFVQKTEADAQKDKAEVQADIAKQNELLAEKEKKEAERQTEIANQQRDRAAEQEKLATKASIRATEQAKIAEQRRIAAVAAEGRASEAAIKAQKASLEAQRQEKIAKQNEEAATRLRYLAIANAMAVKSTQLNDPQLKGLLAQQAYIFDEEYSTYDYSPEIYDGLYYALKEFNHPLTNTLQGHEKAAKEVVAGAADNEFFSGGSQGSIIRWKKSGEKWIADSIAGKRPRRVVKSLVFDASNNTLYAAGQFITETGETIIEKYNLSKPGSEPTKIKGVNGSFVKMRISSNGLYVLDEAGRSIKKVSDNQVTEVYASKDKINDFDFSDDELWLGKDSGALVRYNLDSRKDSVLFNNGTAISAIDRLVTFTAIGDLEGGVKLFSDNNFTDFTDLTGHSGAIDDIKFSDDAAFMLSSSKDRSVRVWNLAEITEQPIVLSDHNNWVWSADFSTNKEFIFSASEDGDIHIWPFSVDVLGNQLCDELERNMTSIEWATFVAPDITYELTCPELEKP